MSAHSDNQHQQAVPTLDCGRRTVLARRSSVLSVGTWPWNRGPWAWTVLLVACLVGLAGFSMTVGPYPVTPTDVASLLFAWLGSEVHLDSGQFHQLSNLLWDIRLPRILAAMLIGAALSVSGAAFQSLFMNPLVSPGLLGVLSGASCGAALAMVLSQSWMLVQISAFAGGLVAVGTALGIARIVAQPSLLLLVLAGVISNGLFVALLSLLKFVADPDNQLPAIVFWLMGRLSQINGATVLWLSAPLFLGMMVLVLHAKQLDVLSMGEEEARSLGVAVERTRYTVIGAATLVSALTVVMAGMIGWVGLVIPHIARFLVGPRNVVVLPVSAAIGALFLLLVDDLARTVTPAELPTGTVTELIGIPLFLLVLYRIREGWH